MAKLKQLQIMDNDGKKVKEIDMPSYFESPIREDIVFKVLETKKHRQPYAPSLVAGKQHAAKGKVNHRRHVWRSGYGRGASRVPRKIFSRRGTQFNWTAAEIPFARGGMRAHPPKVIALINTSKINKKEMDMALRSAISATASQDRIVKKYKTLSVKDFESKQLPFVVEDKVFDSKIKELSSSIKKIVGENIFNVSLSKKSVRSGIGTRRNRRYKKTAGLLIVTSSKEKIKSKVYDWKDAKTLGVVDLAEGEPGRITIYTESAIKELNERFGEKR
ncbi:50S ribosomal protein L4 [Candidatus Pacearchaeota archaeon CG10_big_fil_rev_8_21_14_0_10_32_14]|nr:MAG: 50S ribosomal protein L4 [Candidatus Pacearchaeota archaeon CG10_big_fil_rev_8_21_14_0_10_32_14]